jgi:hypothetical protein
MGFLSKLMKNPLVQAALPFALSAAMPGIGGMFATGGKFGGLGLGSLFGKMNPMAANALKQSMLGYGTAALSGSRRPGKAALAAGLTSIPFSYMSAANAANQFNDQYAGEMGYGLGEKLPGRAAGMENINRAGMPPMQRYIPKVDPVMEFRKMGKTNPRITPMDILTGKYKDGVPLVDQVVDTPFSMDRQGKFVDPGESYGSLTLTPKGQFRSKLDTDLTADVGADIFSKPEMKKMKLGDDVFMGPTGKYKTDFLPTAVSQAAGLYAGRDTPEEEWEAAKKRRIKELAFMYGIDEDQIEGEMDNPFYGGAFMNTGGLASLNMDDGGGVNGPGTGTSDSIDARLSDGEFVMTAKAVENLGGGDRMAGARKMYSMMNMLDPESESMSEVV